MYAVIFQAEFKSRDGNYDETARRMRELARDKYGCVDFVSVCEGGREISISYWQSEEQIRRWKEDKEHLAAQLKGRECWYKWYRIEITEITRTCRHSN